MENVPLCVFAREEAGLSLRTVRAALRSAGHAAGIGVGIAGEATEEELDATDWETAFLRWEQPELHEVALLEREPIGEDVEGTETFVRKLAAQITPLEASAGKLIALDHLAHTRTLYGLQLLPALLEDDEHPAWDALDIVLRCIAENTEGLVFAQLEGFYDADGEILLAVSGLEDENDEEVEEEI